MAKRLSINGTDQERIRKALVIYALDLTDCKDSLDPEDIEYNDVEAREAEALFLRLGGKQVDWPISWPLPKDE